MYFKLMTSLAEHELNLSLNEMQRGGLPIHFYRSPCCVAHKAERTYAYLAPGEGGSFGSECGK